MNKSFQKIITFARLCTRCDKRFLGILILLLLFNVYFFVQFTFYFTDIPEFADNSAVITRHEYLRKSPYIYHNKSLLSSSEIESHTLPSFTQDQTEFIMSAIIERQASVDANHLHVTVFALNRQLLGQGRSTWGPNRVKKEAREAWHTAEKKFRRIYYFRNGTRDSLSNINCKITNAEGVKPYITTGRFIPNTLSRDDSFNSKVDIFRCTMRDIGANHRHLITSNQSVQVQLLRPLRHGKFFSLMNFSIPWSTRRTGYMQPTAPPGAVSFHTLPEDHSSYTLSKHNEHSSPRVLINKETLSFSKWDPWATEANKKLEAQPPLVYLCLCGKTMSPFVDDVALLLEFVQHHLLLGVEHIFLSVRYAWNSHNMHSLLLALRYFIELKAVTVSSQASDGYDRTASTKGIAWGDDFLQLYHCTVTLYMQKGMAVERTSYLGLWSLDEFLIPQHPYMSLASVLKHHPSVNPIHSLHTEIPVAPCYILLQSRSLRLKHAFRHNEDDYPWIGVKFAADFHYLDLINQTWLGAFNFILPVEQSFQLGIPSEASCAAQLAAADVDDALSNVEQIDYDANSADFIYKRAFKHSEGKNSFFESAKKSASVQSSTMLYRYVIERMEPHKRDMYDVSKVSQKNRYVADFFPKVLDSLTSVNLDLIISLNLPQEAARVGTAVEHWPQYKTMDQESVLVF